MTDERRLYTNGPKVSAIGMGTWATGGRARLATQPLRCGSSWTRDGATAVLRAAFDAGITVFDTADAYDAGRRTPRTNEHRTGHEPAVSNPTLRKEMRGRTPPGPKVLSWAN